MDRTNRQEIIKEIEDLNNTINQQDLDNIGHFTQQEQNIHSSDVHMNIIHNRP